MNKQNLEKLIQEIATFDIDAAFNLYKIKDSISYKDCNSLLDDLMTWRATEEGYLYWRWVCNKLEKRREKYHPHRDLMIELANDKTIEIEYLKDDGSWAKYDGMPLFFKFKKYRKKPKVTKKVIECRIYLDTHGVINIVERDSALNISNFKQWQGDWQKVEIEVKEND